MDRTVQQKRRTALFKAIEGLEGELQHPETPALLPETVVEAAMGDLGILRGWIAAVSYSKRRPLDNDA